MMECIVCHCRVSPIDYGLSMSVWKLVTKVCSQECLKQWLLTPLPLVLKKDRAVYICKAIHFRGFKSIAEEKLAKWLLKNDIPYSFEEYVLIFEGKKMYMPDFYIKGHSFLELKGIPSVRALGKTLKAGRVLRLEILTYSQLKRFGIL